MTRAPRFRRLLTTIGLGTIGTVGLAAAVAPVPAALAADPIIDSHVHFYQVTRKGGVPWPKPQNKTLYRDVTPDEYKRLAQQNGVIAAGVVEASPLVEDNFKLLASIKNDDFFPFVIAQLEIGSADFSKNLEALASDRRVVGIRAFLWNPKLTLDAKQLEHLKELARRGMTLDLVSRGSLNPKAKIAALAEAVPDLRIIIDHLGGAKGETPTTAWYEEMRALREHRNVHIKLSSLFDMFNPNATEDIPWESPRTLGAYKSHLDAALEIFGPDRLLFGSNWPVSELGGTFASQIQLAETFFEPLGRKVRNKVMYQNAQAFYRRIPPKASIVRVSKQAAASPAAERTSDHRRNTTRREDARHVQQR